MKEQQPPYLSPQPLVQHQLPRIVVSQYQYKDRGKFEAPALSCDQLSVVVEGANVVERRLEGQCQQGVMQPGDVTIVSRGSASSWMPEIVKAVYNELTDTSGIIAEPMDTFYRMCKFTIKDPNGYLLTVASMIDD